MAGQALYSRLAWTTMGGAAGASSGLLARYCTTSSRLLWLLPRARVSCPRMHGQVPGPPPLASLTGSLHNPEQSRSRQAKPQLCTMAIWRPQWQQAHLSGSSVCSTSTSHGAAFALVKQARAQGCSASPEQHERLVPVRLRLVRGRGQDHLLRCPVAPCEAGVKPQDEGAALCGPLQCMSLP